MSEELAEQQAAFERHIERLKTCRIRPKSRLMKLKEKLEELAEEERQNNDN